MKEKDVSNKFGKPIEDLISSWEFEDILFSDWRSKVIKWLTNFSDDEIEDAFKILSKIEIISSAKIQITIKNLAEVIRSKIGIGDIVISSLEGIGGSSGGQFLYLLQKELVSDNLVRTGRIEDIVSENHKIVLVDDIVGSGGEAINIWNKIKESGSEVYYCPLFCFKEGMNRIKDSNCFTDFFPQHLLDESYCAFSEHSRYFPIQEERNRLKQLAFDYGTKLYPKYPLGYGKHNTQAMLAWGTTLQAPNNSLPIIWAGPKNESQGYQWKPLFERIKVRNKQTVSKTSVPVEDSAKGKESLHLKPIDALVGQVNDAICMHKEGNILEYRLFIYRNKIVNRLKRSALFGKLKDLAYVDLESSLRTRFATSILNYVQSCLVLCELVPALDIIHKKLLSDPFLKTYDLIDKVEFLRTYAEILSQVGRTDLSISILETILNDGIITNLPHNRLSHLQNTLGTFYISTGNIEGAYDIVQSNYDEQQLTTNEYGKAICGMRLGIVLLDMGKAEEAIVLFESATNFFTEFDLRACAWSQLYCHVCAIRLGSARIDHLKSAMSFYSQNNYPAKEILLLLNEIKSSGNGWIKSYDKIVNEFSEQINKCKISTTLLQSAEDYCNSLKASPYRIGANAIINSVSKGEFRQTSLLTNSFIKSLNEEAKQQYLKKISNTDKFYMSPFYNNFIRHVTKFRPDLVKQIVFPKLNEIYYSRDTFRLFYTKLLEYNNFIVEADKLLESVKDKSQFRYLINKGNILSHHRSNIDIALKYYKMAADTTNNYHEKSIAYHNQALIILNRRIIDKYEEAEAFCLLSLKYRVKESFWYPMQTSTLLRIDKGSKTNIVNILSECQKEYQFTRYQLRRIVNEIKDRHKYREADKYLQDMDNRIF